MHCNCLYSYTSSHYNELQAHYFTCKSITVSWIILWIKNQSIEGCEKLNHNQTDCTRDPVFLHYCIDRLVNALKVSHSAPVIDKHPLNNMDVHLLPWCWPAIPWFSVSKSFGIYLPRITHTTCFLLPPVPQLRTLSAGPLQGYRGHLCLWHPLIL